MPRIDWPDGQARLFVLTEITYVPDVRTGGWRTVLVGEHWTAGPPTWGGGAAASGGTALVSFNLVLEGLLQIGVDPKETADAVPPAVVTRIEWWWGDGNPLDGDPDAVVDGEWAVAGLPGATHAYAAYGEYVVGLRLTLDGNPSGLATKGVVVGPRPLGDFADPFDGGAVAAGWSEVTAVEADAVVAGGRLTVTRRAAVDPEVGYSLYRLGTAGGAAIAGRAVWVQYAALPASPEATTGVYAYSESGAVSIAGLTVVYDGAVRRLRVTRTADAPFLVTPTEAPLLLQLRDDGGVFRWEYSATGLVWQEAHSAPTTEVFFPGEETDVVVQVEVSGTALPAADDVTVLAGYNAPF